ncbi:MAG: 6,7-dimethyl-8-ribityllumazine synthase [Limisphaerales bacterium]
MLKRVKNKKVQAGDGVFAIIASRYNARYADAMLKAAKTTLTRAGAKVQVIRVPGAYEIPIIAAKLARHSSESEDLSAIICLGVILRGETGHAAHIGDAISHALMKIQLEFEVPVIHEVLLLENEEQAKKRCLDPKHNRGTEAAQTAIEMAGVIAALKSLNP